jgi:predicted metal-dependent hydrolase
MSRESVDKVRISAELRKRGGPQATGELDPWSCDEIPPDIFYQGLEQFNRGEYFEQHESLEELWIADQRPLRRLYQGILKIGVGFYKLRLGNYRGTVNHIAGGIAYLERFESDCLGVDITRLIREASDVCDHVIELGPERIGEFNLATLPSVHYTRRAQQTSPQQETPRR